MSRSSSTMTVQAAMLFIILIFLYSHTFAASLQESAPLGGFQTEISRVKGLQREPEKTEEDIFKTVRENDSSASRDLVLLWLCWTKIHREDGAKASGSSVLKYQSVWPSKRSRVFNKFRLITLGISLPHLCNSCLYSSSLLDIKED